MVSNSFWNLESSDEAFVSDSEEEKGLVPFVNNSVKNLSCKCKNECLKDYE